MRPTGKLHLGHLVGALDNWVRLQDDFECFYCVVDWHALTTHYDSTEGIRETIIDNAMDWLAAGVDPQRSTIFVQSRVIEHAELHLLLSMIVPLPWLERVPTYKELMTEVKGHDLNTYGFLGYPLLQSADILIYKANAVPVGADQMAHIELTREIARRFNHFYGEVFPEPQTLLTEVPKLPGTDGRKMSKSYGNAVYLSDPETVVRQKILTMVTDPARVRRADPGNPDICPVFTLHKAFSSQSTQDSVNVECRTAGIGCIDCKTMLLGHLNPILAPLREQREALAQRPGHVRDILEQGAGKARQVAAATLEEVRDAVRI